jgi:hypothetical protein
MKRKWGISILVLFLGPISVGLGGQAKQGPVEILDGLSEISNCGGKLAAGGVTCVSGLRQALNAKKIKTGDHFTISTFLITNRGEAPITGLEATIVAVQSGAKSQTEVKIRIDKAVRKDGGAVPIEGRIVAIVSESSISEGWQYPLVIADRYPRIPEDDVRKPGERKYSEDERHSSPLDSTPNVPVYYRKVCSEKRQHGSMNVCPDILEALGVYGYKGLVLGPVNAALPAESVLTSEKNIRLSKGTVLVIEVKNLPRPR